MLTPLRIQSDLPQVGTTYETSRLDFKQTVNHRNRKELAKDVAAFANSVGGTIIVGARAAGERLDAYEPLSEPDAATIRSAYDEAVRDFCSPRPLIELSPIHVQSGVVLAVNVWPFPGHVVAVAEGKSAASADHFSFPYRSGSHTIYLKPDQLPMFMLPEVRRVAILLSSIPPEGRDGITLLFAVPGADYKMTLRVAMTLDLERATLRNTVSFASITTGDTLNIPMDTITHVWETASQGWFIATSAHLNYSSADEAPNPCP